MSNVLMPRVVALAIAAALCTSCTIVVEGDQLPCNVEDWQFGFYTFAFATQDGGDTHVKLECTIER